MANLTTATAITLARLLLDKAESPYYTDAEPNTSYSRSI